MERLKSFANSLKLWQVVLLTITSLTLLSLVIIASRYLQGQAKIKLGSNSGLVLTADREDSLGTFSDSNFTLKSDTDLSLPTLKNNLTFFPEIDFDINQISSRQYSIRPRSPLADNNLYQVKVSTDQKTFSWAFQIKNNFRVVQTLPADKATYVPINTGIEITFSHDNYENIDRYFEITPSVEGRFERHKRTTSFVPKSLLPNTLYTVKLKKGLKLKGTTEVLKDDFSYRFETQSGVGQEQLSFSRDTYEFSTKETPAFDVYSSTGEGSELSVTAYQYPSSEKFYTDLTQKISIPSWASTSRSTHLLPTSGLSKAVNFKTPVNRQIYTSYFIFPQTLPKGFYLVEIGQGKVTTQALVQITDLSAYLSVSGNKTLIWVNDLITTKSVSGAQINFSGKTQTTGNDGVAYFDTPSQVLESIDGTISIQSGNNSLFLPVQSQRYWSMDYQKTRRSSDKYWSYFYTDRPVYLPTDTVKFWGLLRDRDSLNQKQKFSLVVTRDDYQSWDFTPVTLFTKDLETSDLGTFIGDIPLANYSPGWYSVSLKVGGVTVLSSSFSVDTYTKPAYKLTLNSSKKAAIVGDKVTFSGQASFFEGSPVSGMELRFTGAKTEKVITDNLGKFSSEYQVAAEDHGNATPQYRYFNVSPQNPEEGDISADSSIAVFDSSLVFGSSKSSSKNGTGHVEIDLRLVDVDKFSDSPLETVFSPAPSRQITGYVLENEWVKRESGTYYDFINKTTSTHYEYQRVQKRISELSVTTGSNGVALYDFPVTQNKSYNLVVSAKDDAGRVTSQDIYLYSSAEGNSSSTYTFLKTDKMGAEANRYAVGESVNLSLFQGDTALSPSPGDRFMYIYSQRGIKSYQISDSSQTSFKYSDSFVPNVVIYAVRFTGKTYQVSENLYLYFDTTTKKITLDISTDKPQYLPGDIAKIFIKTKGQNGLGTDAEVNLSLVDEAYYRINPQYVNTLSSLYKSLDPDILATYQSHRYPLDVSGAEGGGCFLPKTQILLANGSTKNIENIKVGDEIKTLENSSSKKTVAAKVTKVFKHQVSGYLVINHHLRVTSEHNLYINGRWMTAGEVRLGDSYLDEKGNYQKITSLENYSGLNTVYNFTVDKYSTYFADGVYVHNDKGRELFVDNAFFGIVRTGLDGQGTVDVKLPDNLTSWQITSQAITKDLRAGTKISTLIVKQPFFVDAVMNNQYLVGERPQIIIRSYGEGLSSSDQVSLSLSSPSLGLAKDISLKAFESVKIDLGQLKEGRHTITISGRTGSLSDKLIRNIDVVNSRLSLIKSTGGLLSSSTKPVGSTTGQTRLIFSDLGLGRFLPLLTNLSYTWGDRLDQRLARGLSQELIKSSFDDSMVPEKIDLTPFQTPEGGYSLFPYSSTDLQLSAFVSALAQDRLSKPGLANYFYKELYKSKDVDTASISLFGLASLREPVLTEINNLAGQKSLTPLSRIYLALSRAQIGDKEKAIVDYKTILSDFSKNKDTFTFIEVKGDKDDILTATSLMAALSASLAQPEADSLLAYTTANIAKDVLLVSPQLMAITNQLANTKPSPVSFAYVLNGKKVSKRLEKGQVFKLELSPKDLSNISFEDLNGNIGLTTTYSAPLDPKTAQVDSSVKIGRSYSVRGTSTNTFGSSDLIKVSLPFSFTSLSQDGCYQVSDLLPSGLKPITSPYNLNLDTRDLWYPYEINGQKVSFCVGKNTKTNTINYYARVVSAGEYKSESALIQSLVSPSVFNLSPVGSVSVK